jgi:hypothetical protein
MTRLEFLLPLTVAAGLLASGAQAQESSLLDIERRLELIGHRSLAGVRARPGVALAPFTTDGCSGGLSTVWSYVAETLPRFAESHQDRPPWEPCCITHDRAYHLGGPDPEPEQSYAARLRADEALRQCVLATGRDRAEDLAQDYGMTREQIDAAYVAISDAMFLAVRLGGGPCTGLGWRWGYGFPNCGPFVQ